LDEESFAPSQRQYATRADGGYVAFAPPALPPDLLLDDGTIAALSAADRAIGELAGAGRTLPNPELLAGVLVRREAVLSSRIEGTQASLSELALFEAEEVRRPASDVNEVLNYVAAVQHVLDPNRALPLSLRLLREAHEVLLSGVRGGHATPGEFRRSQSWIGAPGCTLIDATYVPPPPEALWRCLDTFEKFLHSERVRPPLVDIACLHYQFEAIHPFLDGNGRIGRLLCILLMVEWGLLPAPLLDLSAYLEPRRDAYYGGLLRVSTHGDWLQWIGFFLSAVAAQATDAVRRARRLQRLREQYRATVTTPRASSLLPQLVDALFATPALTVTRAQRLLGVSRRAASLNVEKLVAAGIVDEVVGSTRARVFLARGVLAVLDEADPAPTELRRG